MRSCRGVDLAVIPWWFFSYTDVVRNFSTQLPVLLQAVGLISEIHMLGLDYSK